MKKCSNKECKSKGKLIPLNMFHKDKSKKDGLQTKCIECKKEYTNQNKEKRLKASSDWYYNNVEYYSNLRIKNKESNSILQKDYRKNNPFKYRFNDLFYITIKLLVKKDYKKKDLEYTYEDLKNHLIKLEFDLDKDEIDHKIPISFFKPTTPPHLVGDLRNIHKLTIEKNRSKGNRYAHSVDEDYYKEILPHIKEEYKDKIYK